MTWIEAITNHLDMCKRLFHSDPLSPDPGPRSVIRGSDQVGFFRIFRKGLRINRQVGAFETFNRIDDYKGWHGTNWLSDLWYIIDISWYISHDILRICVYIYIYREILLNIKVPIKYTDLRLSDAAKPPRPSLMRIAQMTTSSALSRVSWQIPNETEILRGRWCRVWWYQTHHFKRDIMMIWRGCDQTLISLQNLYKHEWQWTCHFSWGQCVGTTEMKAQNKRRLLYQVVGFSIFLFTAFLGHDCPWLILQGCHKKTPTSNTFFGLGNWYGPRNSQCIVVLNMTWPVTVTAWWSNLSAFSAHWLSLPPEDRSL